MASIEGNQSVAHVAPSLPTVPASQTDKRSPSKSHRSPNVQYAKKQATETTVAKKNNEKWPVEKLSIMLQHYAEVEDRWGTRRSRTCALTTPRQVRRSTSGSKSPRHASLIPVFSETP